MRHRTGNNEGPTKPFSIVCSLRVSFLCIPCVNTNILAAPHQVSCLVLAVHSSQQSSLFTCLLDAESKSDFCGSDQAKGHMLVRWLCSNFSLLISNSQFEFEYRPGHGGSLGGPRMQQELFLSSNPGTRLGVPSGLTSSLPGPSPMGSPAGQRQVSREGSPLLGGLEEIRRELAAMRSADGSHDITRHARRVPCPCFLRLKA